MVKVLISRTPQGHIRAFQVKGHAAWGSYGNDIVCAAVSVLTQTAIIGMEEYLGLRLQLRKRTGFLSCSILGSRGKERELAAILETMVYGLRSIALDYPDNVSIVEEEVGYNAED